MSERSVPTRKRDKLRKKLGLGRSASPANSQTPGARASEAPTLHIPTPSPSSAITVTKSISSTSVASTTSIALIQLILPAPSTPAPLPRGLWFDALQKLSEVDQQAIRSMQLTQDTQQPFPERMEDLVSMTRRKQRECEKDSYRFRFQEREIILRDIAEKIVFWLKKFKEVGDIAVNFDPVHASLPWAGVRFLLQAAVGAHEQMGALLVSVEKVTYLTNRCTIYETMYSSGTVLGQVLHNFHAALVELYAAVLRLIALANRLFAKNKLSQAMHAFVKVDEVTNLLAKCQDLEDRVEIEVANCERKRRQEVDAKTQELLESLQTPILRTDERVSSFLENVEEEDHLKLLNWISNVLYGMNHNTVKDQRTKDTCEWLLRDKHYLEWQDTSSSIILWLHGTAGTGKTYLTSRVIDEIQGALNSGPNHEGLAFFYCNRNETERQEPLSVLRSFLRQLSTTIKNENAMQRRLKQFCSQTQKKCSQLTIGDCKELLLELINLYPKTTLILDALDECDKRNRGVLIEIFDYFLAHASRPVKIFISSRPDADIKERFKSRDNIEIKAADNYNDISRFVESEIAKHPRWNKMSLGLQKEIIETLQNGSQGMFQWAYLQIKQLLELKERKEIQDRLGVLPEDLKDAYDEIRDRMSRRERQVADRAFQWVMCSCKPLSTNMLLAAVCQDEEDDTIKLFEDLDEELLLEYCHNLLVIDAERKVWVSSHLSVIEYFENYLWSQKKAHCLVSSVCLLLLNDTTYYNQANLRQHGSVQNDSPDYRSFNSLGLYARHHWMIHVQKCDEDNNGRLSALLKRFLGSPTNSSPVYQSWYRMIENDNGNSPPSSSFFRNSRFLPLDIEPATSATFAICAFGIYTTLSDWWDNPWTECIQESWNGRSLLEIAAIAGSISVCGRLIEWGTKISDRRQYGEYGTALAEAAMCGHRGVVELLINSGADVNAQLQTRRYGSVLAAAAIWGNMEVVELLIKSGAEVNAQVQAGDHGSALAAAVAMFGGGKGMVELLIKSGADVNAQLETGKYGSVLAAAAVRGNTEVVELLIKSGAEVNAQVQAGRYGSALAAAAFGSKKGAVDLLIKSGADVNALPNFPT